MEGIKERSERRAEVFNKIAERVQVFSTDNNLNVENYDQLLADVNAKKAALVSSHEQATTLATSFDCENGNKENVAAYKLALHAEINAFKEYKTSLKALIKAVKTAAHSTEEGAENEN
jgi:hypothetical protein